MSDSRIEAADNGSDFPWPIRKGRYLESAGETVVTVAEEDKRYLVWELPPNRHAPNCRCDECVRWWNGWRERLADGSLEKDSTLRDILDALAQENNDE